MALSIPLDAHILINLNRDLKNPFAFVVYLHLWSFDGIENTSYFLSHQTLADATGLSKSAIQKAVRFLEDKKLVEVTRLKKTSEPGYVVKRPWLGDAKSTQPVRSKKVESFKSPTVSASHPKKKSARG